ncbi:hypothetical protein AAF712_015231, partial [Marasmius tenuissimus]
MTIPELKDSAIWNAFFYKYTAYLQQQGIFQVLTETKPAASASGYAEWYTRNNKALGVFKSRVNQAFESLIHDIEIIQNFQKAFGQEDTARLLNIYEEFHHATFFSNQNPLPVITKMDQKRKELKVCLGVDIPKSLRLIEKKEDLKVVKLIALITNEWNRRCGAHESALAARISGIHRFIPSTAPPWSRQNRQSGGNSSRSNNWKNNNRSGNGNNSQKQNNNNQGNHNQQLQKGKGKGKGKAGKKKQNNQGKQNGRHLSANLAYATFDQELMAPLQVYMANISTNPLNAIDTDTNSEHSSMPSLVTLSDTDEIDMEISSDSSSKFEEGEVVEQPPVLPQRVDASQAQTAEVPNRSDSPPLPPPSDIDPGVFISHAIATAHAIAQAIMRPVSAPPIPNSPARSFRGTSPFGNNDNAEVDPWVVAQNDPRNTTKMTGADKLDLAGIPYIALSIRFM